MVTVCTQISYLWMHKNEPASVMQPMLLLLVASSLPILFFAPAVGTPLVMQSYVLFLAVLLSCILAYRLGPLHPLSPYPGPLLCKVSKLWMAYVSLCGKQHEYFKALHENYGPIVRVGPLTQFD